MSRGCIVALDGMSGALKSTVAGALAGRLEAENIRAAVIHCDDFYLPRELRSQARLAQAGGNVHYERLKEEVLDELVAGAPVVYRRFDCKTMDFGQAVEVPVSRVYLVEGAYAMHPYFGRYYDLAVFMKVEAGEQLRRIGARNGSTEMFEQRWIPLEQRYQEAYAIEACADLVVDTTLYDEEVVINQILKEIRRFL